MDVYGLIDAVPELPYFILAFFHIFQESDALRIIHVFSASFLFLALTLSVGAVLKVTFKTKRPRKKWDVPVFKYGFPSIHTMISVGAIAFLIFIEPAYALLMIPVGFLYPYSRLQLKVHTGADVTGGALLGTITGWLSGALLLPVQLPLFLEAIFTLLMFIIPILFSIARIRVLKP